MLERKSLNLRVTESRRNGVFLVRYRIKKIGIIISIEQISLTLKVNIRVKIELSIHFLIVIAKKDIKLKIITI